VRTAPRAAAPAAPATVAPGAGPATITGPIGSAADPGDPSRNYVFYSTPFNLRRAGYEQEEFFIAGTATRYPPRPTPAQQLSPATAIGTIGYETRIVVRRPVDPRRSAGVAVVDWQNVTAGHDIDTEWGTSGDFFVSHGWTWIGASVQNVGVDGAAAGPTAGLGLREWNPARYGVLDVTGGGTVLDDSQSFDIYTRSASWPRAPARATRCPACTCGTCTRPGPRSPARSWACTTTPSSRWPTCTTGSCSC
jgi:hypothetical protein